MGLNDISRIGLGIPSFDWFLVNKFIQRLKEGGKIRDAAFTPGTIKITALLLLSPWKFRQGKLLKKTSTAGFLGLFNRALVHGILAASLQMCEISVD